jgi:hypothetical protein
VLGPEGDPDGRPVERAAERLRAGDLEQVEAAALVEECAELAARLGGELDRAARTAAAEPPAAGAAVPAAGGPCTDDMLTLEVRAPAGAALGSKPTFELAVANVSAVPCVRALDKGLQEIVMFDGAGNRVWGSNDCFPEVSSDPRTLAPGEVVLLPVVWGGLSSEPTCTAARSAPPTGSYLLRARLDTKVSPDASIALS